MDKRIFPVVPVNCDLRAGAKVWFATCE
uniref:Uncharacterized protein n=1 Tax=Rhizophora mucronata TaxID=61149 RepID=A0A2P2PS18_RHIMU